MTDTACKGFMNAGLKLVHEIAEQRGELPVRSHLEFERYLCYNIDQTVNTTINKNLVSAFVHADTTATTIRDACRFVSSDSVNRHSVVRLAEPYENQAFTLKLERIDF